MFFNDNLRRFFFFLKKKLSVQKKQVMEMFVICLTCRSIYSSSSSSVLT